MDVGDRVSAKYFVASNYDGETPFWGFFRDENDYPAFSRNGVRLPGFPFAPFTWQTRTITQISEAFAGPTDVVLLVNKTIGSATSILLPTPTKGRILAFKDMKGDSSTNAITLNAGSGKTIDGVQTFTMNEDFSSTVLIGESSTAWGVLTDMLGTGHNARTKLTQDTTFFVATPANGGDDDNSGLVGFPKATAQAMLDDLYLHYDCGGYNVFIQLGDGIYTQGIEIEQLLVGQRNLTIGGNPADVMAVRINVATIDKCVQMIGGNLILQDMTLSNKGNGDGIYCDELAFLTMGNIRFEDVDGQMMFFGGGSHLFMTVGKTVTVAGSGRNFLHFTGKSEASFEDCIINYIQNPTSGNYPTWSVYYLGGNDASATFNRCDITGQFSGAITLHFGAFVKNAPNVGSSIFPTFYAPGVPTNVVNAGGAIFSDPVQPSTYVGLTGNDLSEGFTAALPVLNFSTAMTLMAARYQSAPFAAPPVMQVNDNSYSASIVLFDIPGCPLAYCRGNPTTPANCVVKTIQNRAKNTYWIIDGFTFNNAGDENVHTNGNAKTGIQNCVFQLAGPTNSMITIDSGGFIEATGPNSVTGGAGSFISNNGGNAVFTQTITFFNAIVFGTATVVGNSHGKTRWTGTKTMSGGATVTATRVDLKNGAFLDSNNTTDQTSIPGTVDGVVDSATFALMV